MKNIVLIGMMGCGKTTCGRLLAEKLGRELVDTDALIEAREGRSVAAIFAEKGEPFFRDLETLVARKLSREENLVVATGGGMPLRRENRLALRENGVVVFLNRPAEDIFRSVSMAGRPLGQGGQEEFLRTFARRESAYRDCAHITAERFETPEDTVGEILEKLKEQGECGL